MLEIPLLHCEHFRYIKTNNAQSADAVPVLDHQHEYGSMQDAIDLIIYACKRATVELCGKCLHTVLPTEGKLIEEQNTGDFNLLYEFMHDVQLKYACAKLSYSLDFYLKPSLFLISIFTPTFDTFCLLGRMMILGSKSFLLIEFCIFLLCVLYMIALFVRNYCNITLECRF